SGNTVYVAELYERYLDDPGSVDLRWQNFFKTLEDDPRQLMREQQGASWAPRSETIVGHAAVAPLAEHMAAEERRSSQAAQQAAIQERQSSSRVREATLDSLRALMLIRAYRVRGHLHANLDPLGLTEPE